MHPAKEGFSALPFFDEFDLSTVDVLLISQYVHLFCLHYIRNHGKHDRRSFCTCPYEAPGLFGSLLPSAASMEEHNPLHIYEKAQYNSMSCIYFLYHCTFLSLELECFLLRRVCSWLSHLTNSMVCIVSTSIIRLPSHMFSARQTSKEESS